MAEYAGLEIRIGGNTTSLNNALKASTKSAAELQSRIRQATRAMQFDPTDLKNVDTRIRLTGDRMQSLQSKVQLARTAMEQLGNSMVTFKGDSKHVSEVVSTTKNLSLEAKQADERFNDLRDSLATVYETWNRAARTEGTSFMQEWLHIDAKTAGDLMSANTSLDTLRSTIRQINAAREAGLMEGPIITPEDIDRVKQLKTINFHGMFESGADLDELIAQAQNLGVTIDSEVVDAVRAMRTEFIGAQQDKNALDKALQFDQIGVDVQRMDSEVVSLSQDMRRLDDGMTSVSKSQPFQGLESRMREVDAALDNVTADLERTESALKLNPDSVDLAVRRLHDLQQQAELSDEKASLLRRELGLLGSTGVDDAIKEHQDLAKWIEESAEAARKAGVEYSEQKATVSNLSNAVEQARQSIAKLGESNATASMTEGAQKWMKQTQALEKAQQTLSQRTDYLGQMQDSLEKAQSGFDEASAKADQYESSLVELRTEYQRLQEAQAAAQANGDETAWLAAADGLDELHMRIGQVEQAYSEAQSDVKSFESAIKTSTGAVTDAKNAVAEAKGNVSQLTDSVNKLEGLQEVRAFKNFPEEAERANTELTTLKRQLGNAMVEEKRLASAYKAAESENELAKTANKVNELNADLEDTSNVARGAREAVADVARGGVFNASTIKSLGMTLSATVTPALSVLGYKMVDASSTVDAAYRDMRKTVEGTEEQFEALKQSAVDFSRTHVTSADQILDIMAIGGELGIATENLETFAEVISNLDVATNLDTEGAAEALGHLANIMHLSEDDYVGFSDALVRLGNNGASTETEIANIAERIGSMASIVGMSAPDVLAWASSIASTGQNAEAAGTAISKTMSFFETAVASAGGTIDASFENVSAAVQEGGNELIVFSNLMGMTADEFAEEWAADPESVFGEITDSINSARDSLQGIADVAHMTSDDFVKAWENDPTAVMEAFINGLNDIEAAGGSADSVLQGFDITAVRQKQAIEGLMQTIGGLDDNLEMSRNAWSGVSDQWGQAGDAANEAAKKAEGFSGQVQILKNMFQIFLSELGEGAVPYIKAFSGTLEGLSTLFSGLDTSVKTTVVGLGGFFAALGPILSFTGTLKTSYGEFTKWADEALNSTALVRHAFKLGGEEAVAALTGTMTTAQKAKLIVADMRSAMVGALGVAAFVAAVATITAALKEAYETWKTHKKATEGLSAAIAGIGEASEKTAGELGLVNSGIGDIVTKSDDYESRLAHLADTISESNQQYETYAGKMTYYSDVIRDLGGRAGLSSDEMSKLSAAVAAVNDEIGTTYAVDEYGNIIDTTTGQVQQNTDAILANIDARKQQALMDYYADDYAEATENWAAAQARQNDLQERYNKLTSEVGHQDYIRSHVADGSARDAAEAEYQYGLSVEALSRLLDENQQELDSTSKAMSNIEAQMDIAQAKMNESNRVVEDAAKAQEEYDRRSAIVTSDVTGNMNKLSKAVSAMGGSDSDFNNMADGLEAIHVYAEELGGVDMSSLASAFDSTNGSMADIVSTLEAGGVQMWTWNSALEQVPDAAEKMGSVTASAFQSMYETAGNDLGATMTLISGLDSVMADVDGEQVMFYIGDNGSIFDAQGKLYDIQNDIASIPDEVITAYYVDDEEAQQKALDAKDSLNEVAKQNPTPTITAVDYATAKADYVSSRLDRLNGKTATTYINTVTRSTQATGGMNGRPVIPRHATGYIATGPTLTNQGWIGEDGIEAVANWATGGAVVPLTNERYMLPIANAIAEGMVNKMGGMQQPTTNTYMINGLTVAPDSALAKAMDSTFDEARRYARMGRR